MEMISEMNVVVILKVHMIILKMKDVGRILVNVVVIWKVLDRRAEKVDC